MINKELDVGIYASIHSASGYDLATTAEVYIPWFKCIAKCKCEKEYPMSELDKIFCLCIEKEINNVKDLSFVLSLEKEIVEGEIERLLLSKIINSEDEQYYLTEFGRKSFECKVRLNTQIKDFIIYFNSITGEWYIPGDNSIFEKKVEDSKIKLSPVRTVVKEDIENNIYVRKCLEDLYDTKVISVQLAEYKVIEFFKENILFYQNNEEQILFEIYDEQKGELDIELSAALRKKYEKREILELMKAEKHLEIANNKFFESVKDEHPIIEPPKSSLRYLRNQEIRELFLKELKEAKTNLFIVSPWITDFVVDNELINKIENILKKGVNLDIGFGYVSMEKMLWKLKKYEKEENGANSEREKKKIEEKICKDKEMQSWKMAHYLKEKFRTYDNFRIFYVREGTHEKVFCFDKENILIGSYNLLSYDGGENDNYSGFKFRYEGGVLIKDNKFVYKVIHDFECSFEEI